MFLLNLEKIENQKNKNKNKNKKKKNSKKKKKMTQKIIIKKFLKFCLIKAIKEKQIII